MDFEILREWLGQERGELWFDPRISPEVISERLGVSPATVRRRINTWRAEGFLLGFDVLPHPELLGGRLAARLLDFSDPIDQERAVEKLGLIDGVTQIVPGQSRLLAIYFVDSESQSQRRFRQLEGIQGVTKVSPEMAFEFPSCGHRMARADWRLILALRRSPESRIAELAKEVGQSGRTTSRRYNSLLDEWAVIFDPILDFSRFSQTLANLMAHVERKDLMTEIERAIRVLHPQSIHSSGPSLPDSYGETNTVHLWVAARTSGALDELAVRVAHLTGVRQVDLWYGRSTLPVRPWLNERIELMLKTARPAG